MGSKQTGATVKVYDYIRKFRGEYISSAQVASDLGISKDDASSTLARFCLNPQSGIRRMQGARGMYGYFGAQPDAQSAPEAPKVTEAPRPLPLKNTDLLEILGQSSKFGLLARDTDGTLYKVEKLD